MASLAQRGIKIQPTLVYYIKSKAKHQKGRQARRRVAQTMQKSRGSNPVELILKVKGLAAEVGGMGMLKTVLEALSE